MANQETIGFADATHSLPRVRAIIPRDLFTVLAKGLDDFWAMPTHVIFLSLVYPTPGRRSAWTCCHCSIRWRPVSP